MLYTDETVGSYSTFPGNVNTLVQGLNTSSSGWSPQKCFRENSGSFKKLFSSQSNLPVFIELHSSVFGLGLVQADGVYKWNKCQTGCVLIIINDYWWHKHQVSHCNVKVDFLTHRFSVLLSGFSVTSAECTRIFKPVSIQTMWWVHDKPVYAVAMATRLLLNNYSRLVNPRACKLLSPAAGWRKDY